MCGVGASCVCKLALVLKQGSCLLQLLRKIYLYLQFDAFNTVGAQVAVFVGTQRGREGGHEGPK